MELVVEPAYECRFDVKFGGSKFIRVESKLALEEELFERWPARFSDCGMEGPKNRVAELTLERLNGAR